MFTDKKQKVIKYDTNEFKVKYGFMDRFNNKSLFVNLTTWVKILGDGKDYTKFFDKSRKRIKQYLFDNLEQDIYDNTKYIVDIDIRRNGLSNKNKSYLEIEITLFSKDKYFDQNNKLSESIESHIKTILETLFISETDFEFTIKK